MKKQLLFYILAATLAATGDIYTASVPTAEAGSCDYSWQTDSAGRRCGGRAASVIPADGWEEMANTGIRMAAPDSMAATTTPTTNRVVAACCGDEKKQKKGEVLYFAFFLFLYRRHRRQFYRALV